MITATLTHVFLCIFAGNLVTAVSASASRAAEVHKAVIAVMAGLGLSQTLLR